MPDSFNTGANGHAPNGAPRDWNEAFAALPLETPPADCWPRIVQAQDARKQRGHRAHRERRTTGLIGLASAAVLVMAAWSPLSHWLQDQSPSTGTPATAATAAPASRGPATSMQPPSNTRPEGAQIAATDALENPIPASNANRDSKPTAAAPVRSARADGTRKTAPRLATRATTQPQVSASGTTDSVAATVRAPDVMQDLQAQSARLEALVAIARDERVGNASSELLSAELDSGIAAIDEALSHDDLDDARRQQLWQQRVDLLQQLAGVESTARWLAAQGMSNETALVSVD